MPERRSGGPVAGLLGSLLIVGGLVVRSFPSGPGSSGSIERHVRWFQDTGQLTQLSVSWLMATVGGILVLWGLADIGGRLGGGDWKGAATFLSAGVAYLILLLLGFTLAEALPAAGFFDAFLVDAGTARILLLVAGGVYILTVQAAWFGAAAVLLGSIGLLRARGWPRWLGGLGIALALTALATSPFSESTAAGVPIVWMAVVMGFILFGRPASVAETGP
ncbi:MAG: hypothetical protein WCE80_01235 [Acidimicrobiia bacterium]